MFEKLEELAKNNKKISDFHLRAGSPLAYRQTGEIIKVKDVMTTNIIFCNKNTLIIMPLTIVNARQVLTT